MPDAYHFTSFENWQKIYREGLVPYPLRKPSLEKWYGKNAKCIYAWPEPLEGHALIGQVIHRAMDLRSWHIVLLKFPYQNLISLPEDEVTHDGELNKWVYHENVPMLLVADYIPPENIECVANWDIAHFIMVGMAINV